MDLAAGIRSSLTRSRRKTGGPVSGWPALSDPPVAESSTRRSSARRHRSTCADTRRSRRHRRAQFRTDRVRYVLSLNSPCQCLRTGFTPSSKEIDWTDGLKKGPYVERVLPSSGRSLDRATRLAHKRCRSSEIWGDMAKSKDILPNHGRGFDGSPGSDVDLFDRGRAGQLVRSGAAIENAAHNNQPQRIRARVSPADEALQPIEPAVGANGCRRFLRCGLQAHSH